MGPGSVLFDRYLLLERIGAGGGGVVWKATDQRLQQTVALKRVHVDRVFGGQAPALRDRALRDRALREARLAAQLRGHPHVVSVYDVHAEDADIWLVMEYVPARSLRDILRARGPLDPAQVARIGAAVADALAAGHDLGIEHRDVKPGNVLISDDGTVKLTDYGISALTGDPRLTQVTTTISGTPAYLAPEIARGGGSSPASDVFSLGATLYAAVEGQPPFGTDDNADKLLNVVRTGIVRAPVLAGPLEPLLLRLLQPTPDTRPDAATAREQLAQLARRLGAGAGPVTPPEAAPGRRWWRPRGPVAVAAGAVVLLAVATTAIVAALGDAPEVRYADPCSLVDLTDLAQFGTPAVGVGPFLHTCDVGIDTPTGNRTVHLQVELHSFRPGWSPGGQAQRIGDVTAYQRGMIAVAETEGCQVWLVGSPEQPVTSITSYTHDDEPVDLCSVTRVATTSAVERYEQDGIDYDTDRIATYSVADADACSLLTPADLHTVPDVPAHAPRPGFANWSCRWGAGAEGGRVSVRFELRGDAYLDEDLGAPTTIAGKPAYSRHGDDGCDVYLVHRPSAADSDTNEVLFVGLRAPSLTGNERCDAAEKLAEAVQKRLA